MTLTSDSDVWSKQACDDVGQGSNADDKQSGQSSPSTRLLDRDTSPATCLPDQRTTPASSTDHLCGDSSRLSIYKLDYDLKVATGFCKNGPKSILKQIRLVLVGGSHVTQ